MIERHFWVNFPFKLQSHSNTKPAGFSCRPFHEMGI